MPLALGRQRQGHCRICLYNQGYHTGVTTTWVYDFHLRHVHALPGLPQAKKLRYTCHLNAYKMETLSL